MSENFPFNDRMRSIRAQIITLAVALALLVVGLSAPAAFADRTVNQLQSLEQSTSTCGEKAAEPDSTGDFSSGGMSNTDNADPSTSAEVQDDNVSARSNTNDADDEEEIVPARPFDGRPR